MRLQQWGPGEVFRLLGGASLLLLLCFWRASNTSSGESTGAYGGWLLRRPFPPFGSEATLTFSLKARDARPAFAT